MSTDELCNDSNRKSGNAPKRIGSNPTLFTINPTLILSIWDCQGSEHGDYNHLGYDTKKLLL